jgi:hypothetical protein
VADLGAILGILTGCGWQVEEAARRDMLFEIIHLFRLTEPSEMEIARNIM